MKRRNAALSLAATLAVAGVVLSFGAPRVLWLNTGLRIEYEWQRGAGALLAAGGAAGLALGIRKRAGRLLTGALAILFAAFGAHRLAYRVDAVDDALRVRTVFGTTSLPWASIARVDARADHLRVTSDEGTTQAVGADLTPDQRAAFERTVARRLREASEARIERPAAGEGPPKPEPP